MVTPMIEGVEGGAEGKAVGRRRYVTILFSDLSRSTDLAAALEAEDYADVLATLRSACESVIPAHGGIIVQIQGDGVLAMFGYPDVGEYDGRRAAEAALDLHETIRGIGADREAIGGAALALHTGIHAGLVLVDEGDSVRGRFGVLGRAVNIAARLSDEARANEILVSEETLAAEAYFFETGERRVLKLVGVDPPISVRAVIGRAAVETRLEARARRGLAPFVGRAAELARLSLALEEARVGRIRYFAVAAPPGMGKSRLAGEFLAQAAAAGCQIHRGYCESYLSAEPLQPFLQILRKLGGLRPAMAPLSAAEAITKVLGEIDPALRIYRDALLRELSLPSPGGKHDLPSTPHGTVGALKAVFAALAKRGPLVLFIDDWQWADDATRQVLAGIRSLDSCPILVLVATRDDAPAGVGLNNAELLSLAPFTDAESQQTIARLIPSQNPFLMEEIRTYCGGNPLFIEELCHAPLHRAVDLETNGRRIRRTPGGAAWLSGLIESRLGRLEAAEAELVRLASVIGNVIPLWLLESISGYGAEHPILRAVADHDFILEGESPGTLRFKHAIARDVIYDSVGLRERTRLHGQVAQALRRYAAGGVEEEWYEPLAYHFAASGAVAEAARYAERAGDKAMASSALDRAQLQYRSALDAIDQLESSPAHYERWMTILEKLATACVFDPSRDQLPVLERAIERAEAADDRKGLASAEFWLGYVNYALGEQSAARQHFERALAEAQALGEESLALRIQATLGQSSAAAGDYQKALTLLEPVIAGKHSGSRRGRPSVGFVYTLACKASVLGDQGAFADAHACFEEALDAVSHVGFEVAGSVLCWRSGVWLWQGRWAEARQCALEAQQIAEQVKSLYIYTMGVCLGAYAHWVSNRDGTSLQTMRDATAWLASRDRGLFISLNYGWLVDATAGSGRWPEARLYAARAIQRGRKLDRLGGAMAWRGLARAAAAGKSRGPARRYLDLAMRTADLRGSAHERAVSWLCDAEISHALGHTGEARALLHRASEALESLGMAWHLDEARRLERLL
jgi:class 3 adenylate cyclase/tetratricopeptide (TPR) repeat protein